MGKKSLIKSTTKKKSGTKEKEEKTTPKTSAKATKKTASKTSRKPAAKTAKKATYKSTKKAAPKAPKKSAGTTTKKTAAKKSKKASPKKTAAKKAAPKKTPAAKKVTAKDLVFKKFEALQKVKAPTASPRPFPSVTAAPPIISSTDPAEVKRLQSLLFKKFNMDAIKAAAKEPKPYHQAEPATSETKAPQAAQPAVEAKPAVLDQAAHATGQSARISVAPDEPVGDSEPMNRAVKFGLAAAAIVIFLILAVSYNNSTKYYIQAKDNAIEIWKGRFSPKDKQFFMVLHGTQIAEPIKGLYTREEVYPIIFNYYIEKADTLLEVPGLPDFEGIKEYLHKAETYVVGLEMKTAVTSRLNNIERMTLLYKADVAMSKNTEDSLKSSIKLYKEASKLTPSPAQAEEIAQKIETAKIRLEGIKAQTQ